MHPWIMLCCCVIGWMAQIGGEEVPVVLVSVAPYQFLVEQLAQGSVRPQLMVPSGASAHSYEPTVKQMQEAALAKVWLGIGEPFEKKAVAALRLHRSDFRWIDLREGLDLLFTEKCSCHAGADPHIWLSLRLLGQQAKTICAQLQELKPSQALFYAERLSELLQKFSALDHAISAVLQPFHNTILAVSHPAYGYFCRDYGLIQIAIEQEGRDPTIKQILGVEAMFSKNRVSRIFVQPQYSDKAARLIAEQLSAKLVTLDPYTADTPTFLKELAHAISLP